MFCQLAPGEQGDVVKLAGKAAENRFIVAGPKMNPVDSASWKRCAIAYCIKGTFIVGIILTASRPGGDRRTRMVGQEKRGSDLISGSEILVPRIIDFSKLNN